MKHEWRKKEKQLYLPKNKPELVVIPEHQFLTIAGKGDPNSASFTEYISVLYALSYAIKMNLKKGAKPHGYVDYTVYPLEGIWDITEEAKQRYDGKIDKNDLVFNLMIRQPDFIHESFFKEMMAQTKKKKPHVLLEDVKFKKITDSTCIQMMHLGTYDHEPESFQLMEVFAKSENLIRPSKVHREIYLSDVRKVAPEKLKTVLRFKVETK